MSAMDWLRNARGEWDVVAQAGLMAAVLFAPVLDARAIDRSIPFTDTTVSASGALCIAGLAFPVLGSVSLGSNLSPFPRPKDASSLVETGVFSIVRHPIYRHQPVCLRLEFGVSQHRSVRRRPGAPDFL